MATAWQSVIAFTSAVNYGLTNDGVTAATIRDATLGPPLSPLRVHWKAVVNLRKFPTESE